MFISYLGDSKSLLLVDDSQVFFNLLGVEVLSSASLQLKGVLLEILKPDTEKHFVRCINCLYTVLRIYV